MSYENRHDPYGLRLEKVYRRDYTVLWKNSERIGYKYDNIV